MNVASKILSFLAITIIIAHAIFPHTHHSEMTEGEHLAQHQQAETIFDYVALGFHFEQQEGALEQFVQDSDNIVFECISISIATVLHTIFFPSTEQEKINYFIVDNIPIKDNLFTSSLGLRGPPLKS